MIKKTKSISINIVSVLIILTCLFIGVVGNTNSWFTAEHKNGVQIIVDIGNLKLKLYKDSIDENGENLIHSYEDEETQNKQYIDLQAVITPNDPIDLVLILSNEDKGSASMFLKYKFEMFYRTIDGTDGKINLTLHDYKQVEEASNGFKYNSGDGFYYYQSSLGATSQEFNNEHNTRFAKNSNVCLMQSFSVDYSEFIDENNESILNGSETVYLKLTVEASAVNWTAIN